VCHESCSACVLAVLTKVGDDVAYAHDASLKRGGDELFDLCFIAIAGGDKGIKFLKAYGLGGVIILLKLPVVRGYAA